MSIVSIRLKGGLGNYMFQIATCEAYALEHEKKPLYNFGTAYRAQKEINSYVDNIFRGVNLGGNQRMEISYNEPTFEYIELPKTDKNIILDGYFQSEQYFGDYGKEIGELFSESEEVSEYINSKYGKMYDTKDLVSVHVRRGDYKKYPDHHPILNLEYYKNAISSFNTTESRTFFVFSDDIEWCVENFKGEVFDDVEIIYSQKELDYIDLYLMSRCNNHIIANSSFSWWGAWLNPKEGKSVIAPDKWFGKAIPHNTKDLIPKEWKKMSY